ncbi:Procollagen-lysine,2-oxoglutarate 5-dioxygenase 2 [Cichlidogyrus casuarinus]|uniref:RNA polymerase II-associated factor 1 homolog n=1 Tax=Cichlidogyrus casuarinus TaxID=1844966 RepID=A0ABD2QEZ7_9PLAT
MPSTPTSGRRKDEDVPKERVKTLRPETLLCRAKYRNVLPEIPLDPKFRIIPLDYSRFVGYVSTSLERNYKHDLLVEPDVGVEVDLIDPLAFVRDPNAKLHPEDEALLEDELPVGITQRKSRHNQSVSWLRKTEYISTEVYTKYSKSERIESKLGFNLKRQQADENIYRDRQSQIVAIEKTFEASKKPITKHYSKQGVTPVEVFPVLPDFRLWKYPCAQVIFDDNPARKNLTPAEQREEVTQAMIRGMVDETGDHFVAYFLPTDQTKQQRRIDSQKNLDYSPDVNYEYELCREYNWNVKNKTMTNFEENYFFVFRKDGVFYNELETRVRLSKRRKIMSHTVAGAPQIQAPLGKTRLVVQHRDFTEDEFKAQTMRLYMLEHEDVEEASEEEENEEENAEGQASKVSSEREVDEGNKSSSESATDQEEAEKAKKTKQVFSDSSSDEESNASEPEAPPKASKPKLRPPSSSSSELSDLSD